MLARLVALVVLATIPAFAVQAWNQHALRRARTLELHTDAQQTAREVMIILSRTVDRLHATLAAFAEDPIFRAGDPASCATYLRRLASHYPDYAALSRESSDGTITCVAAGAALRPASHADHPEIREARETSKFAIGSYSVDGGTPAWNMTFPLRDEYGAVTGFLSAGISLRWLAAEIGDHLRPGVQVVVTDRNGTVLVHLPEDSGHWIGSRSPPNIFSELQRGAPSWTSPLQGEGSRLFVAAKPTDRLHGAAFVGASLDHRGAFAATDAAGIGGLALTFAGLLLAIAAAILGGEAFVRRPIAALLLAIEHWRRGDYSARVEFGNAHSDFRRLGQAFNVAAVALNHRETKLRNHNAQLEASLRELRQALRVEAEDRASTEAELRQAHKMEIVGRLTGGVAHDFNNLLTVIIGNLEFLLRGAAVNERGQRLADAALRAAHRGANLTASLLAFARRQAPNLEIVDVNSLLVDFATLLRRAVGERVVIDLRLAKQLPPSRVDVAQLEAAILNLGINARDAMPSGGLLTVTTSEAELTPADLMGNPDAPPGRYTVISITDTGTGMSSEVVARAFEPFFTTKPTGSGSGLGLSQVFDFVRQVGGHLTLASEPGRGTDIKLFLPQAKAALMPTFQTRPQPFASPNEFAHGQIVTISSASVLVVEDDPDVSDLVQHALRDAGCRVIAARDGREAMRVLEQSGQTIDLVFTDLIMPNGVSGLEVAHHARRLLPGVAVVLTSGQDPDTPEDARAALEFPILRKPYRLAEPRALIAQTLQRAPEPRRA